jgi:hypothetical protein
MSSDLLKENLKDGLSRIQAFLDGVPLKSDDQELHVTGDSLQQLKKKKKDASAALTQIHELLSPSTDGYSERGCPPQWADQTIPSTVH